MPLVLTEEQELLRETAKEFLNEHSPVARARELSDPVGFSRELWKEMAQLGWTGIVLPEEYDGSELGYAELGVILEECGRRLVPEPFVSTVLLGGNAILLAGSPEQRKSILPGIASGEKLLALAFQEQGRFDPYAVATKAERTGSGFCLTGEKLFVLDAHVADHLVVTARTSGGPRERAGLGLFLVDPAASGVSILRTTMVDGRNAARVRLDGVDVEACQLLGDPDAGADVLDRVFDRATVGLAAEMLGGFSEAFERTIEYLKTREQFGVPIGSFQALKHRAAEMFCELELSRSVVMAALRSVDGDETEAPSLVSAAKARCSDAFVHIACEALQMHGGIGMTDEEEIGLFLKRGRAAALTFGDGSYHRDRYARLNQY